MLDLLVLEKPTPLAAVFSVEPGGYLPWIARERARCR